MFDSSEKGMGEVLPGDSEGGLLSRIGELEALSNQIGPKSKKHWPGLPYLDFCRSLNWPIDKDTPVLYSLVW